jgi:hypothetical protein
MSLYYKNDFIYDNFSVTAYAAIKDFMNLVLARLTLRRIYALVVWESDRSSTFIYDLFFHLKASEPSKAMRGMTPDSPASFKVPKAIFFINKDLN